MGLIKEYVDRAVQTQADVVPSPYADPAVVLAAPSTTRREHTAHHNSTSSIDLDSAFVMPQSPISQILAPVVSRRASKRKQARCPTGEIVNRRIVSMPESRSEASFVAPHSCSNRVVSMPDCVRPVFESSAELFQSVSTISNDSFGSYSGRRERVRVFRTPSDVPQTPSPPSSPDSLLIIAAGAQLPEGFLRRKYSEEPLIEEDEDWITWANSPPRPIPALHGPLSLPYARCPSGAEGTIIEEPDNVAQMIWGLGPDDQPHSQVRVEGLAPQSDNPQNIPSHGSGQAPPRLQKKRILASQQVSKSTRTQTHAKQNVARVQRQAYDDKHGSLSQISPDAETHQDILAGLAWNEGLSTPVVIGAPDNPVNDAGAFPDSSNRLEWQFTRLRQALRNSLADVDSYSTYSGRLEPIIPAAQGLSQPYPRIFVEPRPNELASSVTRPTSELPQQLRQQQLYRQALQKQKLQMQNILPTPPSSSSPQWSSHFSPYLTYCSTLSPELVGSTEQPIPVVSQKHRSVVNASQYLRHVYDRHEQDNANGPDANANVLSATASQIVPNINAAASRQSLSSSSTLAKYIKQLQALSPISQISSLQPVPPPGSPLPPLPSDEDTVKPLRNVLHSPVVPTPPSPESPQVVSRRSPYHNTRLMPPTRPLRRRLSSLPEEGTALAELSMSVSPRLQVGVMTDNISSSHDGAMRHQVHYPEKPSVARTSDLLPEFDSNLGSPSTAFHETSPVKVRLPGTKVHDPGEQTSGCYEPNKEGRQHGHRRKHRYKKSKGAVNATEQESTHGLVD